MEQKRVDNQVIRENEQWVMYDADVNETDPGPDENWTSGSPRPAFGEPYDTEAHGSGITTKEDETWDYTTYNLGLGYYFTENLQFDLMFSGNAGHVHSDVLFASFTIIFP